MLDVAADATNVVSNLHHAAKSHAAQNHAAQSANALLSHAANQNAHANATHANANQLAQLHVMVTTVTGTTAT